MKRVLGLVRWLAGVPGIRRLTGSELLLRLSFALRASLVSERRRFARNELRRRAVTIPALLTSGMKNPETATLPAHTGFLSKPYSHSGLLAALQRLQPAH